MGRKPSGKPSIDRIRRIQKNGYVYVYERTRVLDEETHKYKSSQTLLGRLPDGSEDLYGELLPTRPKRKALNLFVSNPSQPSIPESDKLRTGMIDIVSNICDYSGLYSVFNTILSDEAGIRQKILTCAWYDFASDGDTWPGITNWSTKYQGLLPYSSGPITKNMYHSLFAEIGTREDIKIGLFQKLCDGLEDETLLALDSSTFFTESENLVNARNAVHKDGQIKNVYKIVYFYAINCRKPIAYAIIPGNIPDSETVYNALLQLQMLRLNNVEIVSDNGYCTEPVIALYLEKSQPFLTRIEADIKWISPIIEKNRPKLEHGWVMMDCDPKFSGYQTSIHRTFIRRYEENGKSIEKEVNGKVHVFIYFSSVNKAKDDVYFRNTFKEYKDDLLLGRYLGDDQKKIDAFARKYMVIERDEGGRIINITPNKAACEKKLKTSGYLVLLSNKETDLETALVNFRQREYIEETIKNFKGHTGGRKPRVWSDDTLDGEVFVQFVSLIMHDSFESRINKIKSTLALPNGNIEHDTSEVLKIENKLKSFLYRNSLHDVLQWFDAIVTREYYEKESDTKWDVVTETTKRDKLLLNLLGIV